ncbi:phasin family protein [Neptuniibacter caesariensis]|uniref:Putative granule-associated protein n=1 Tax=Neptuniibacter caesariensis TaxID=207954 RepID=A0A7U8C6C9_NEPCE|nr:phasin family protein [Neptuniibacter caesariensis]EAR62403.1 putative granule-associated protein [Oceanospirillum sp. MED92] [Neptuniibacter caesariensis]
MYAANNPFADFFKPEMSKEIEALFKPMQNLAEVNTKTVETLVSLQKAYIEELANASVEQFKTLCECKDPKEAMDLQVKFYKSVEAKMTEAAEKGVAAMTVAKDAYVATVEESTKQATEMAEEVAKKAAEMKVA